MALTNERAEMLANYFVENENEAEAFAGLSVNEAVEKINADGLDITTEEFEEFADALEKMAGESGELSEDSLDDVSGGVAVALTLGIGFGIAVCAYKIVKYVKR